MSGFRERMNSLAVFLWNNEEKTFLGRGGKGWAEIGVFYLIYYSCLAGFFCGMLAVFYQTVDESRPKLTGDSSLLKGNPGMGFQPMPDVEYTLVRFREPSSSYKAHFDSIMKVLKPYKKAHEAKTGVDCSTSGDVPEDEACQIDYEALTKSCNEANSFGYGLDPPRPCILMRLNKIFDWMPETYSDESVAEFDEEMQEVIRNAPDMIYIQCIGENPADKDNLGTNITYYPSQGFPHFYYPYRNQKGYLAPVVFVQFNSAVENIAMMVECRALAPNINYDRQEKEGGVHFELLIDP